MRSDAGFEGLRGKPRGRSLLAAGLALGLVLVPAGCGSGGGASGELKAGLELVSIHSGRVVDVYGLVGDAQGNSTGAITLYQTDVLIGSNIVDEREVNSNKADFEIQYDFIGTDPETLQPKLLITRVIGSPDFKTAYDALDKEAILLTPGTYGQDTKLQPFSVSGRNCALRLTFNQPLGLPKDFFLEFDEIGRPIGLKNPEAVEMLEIVGDPTDGDPIGDFKRIPCRIAHRDRLIFIDPVLLGAEGKRLNVPNRAWGMPESPTSTLPNIRLTLALAGPLRIPGLSQRTDPRFIGTNLAGRVALIRDFRAGNAKDTNDRLQNGFIREKLPPRIVGDMRMRLERVEKLSETLQILTIYKAGIIHEIDRGDVLNLHPLGSNTSVPVAVTEVILDPEDDRDKPEVDRVRVRVRSVDDWLAYDPSKDPGFPADIDERKAWLLDHGPLVILSAEFFGGEPGKGIGDRPENFLTFSPQPIPDPGQTTTPPGRNVSPFANIVLKLSKPVNIATVKPLDTLILATEPDAEKVLDPKLGTPHLIASQIFDEDGSATALRIAPPMGFYLDDSMRGDTKKTSFPYYLHVIGGFQGILDFAGNPIDFQRLDQGSQERSFSTFEFHLDSNVENNVERFPDNRVINIVRRFAALDEDESDPEVLDFFGPIAVVGGQAIGRPLSRGSSWVDDKNQLPSPPNPPFSFCGSGETSVLTGGNPVGGAILNPLNPWGARLQNVWREIDLSLSRTDPIDFNLDVEQMFWAPYQGIQEVIYDIFDRETLYIGHSEYRPDNCINVGAALPAYTSSGLQFYFDHNWARNLKPSASNITTPSANDIEERPEPHIAFQDQQMVVQQSDVVWDPTNNNRFLPFPKFRKQDGYFVFRDEALDLMGGGLGRSQLLSPFGPNPNSRFWDGSSRVAPEDGRIGVIGLPIMADFWSYVDNKDLPKDDPFFATGANGLQLSICVTSSAVPYFRVYSGGSLVQGQNAKYVRPGDKDWEYASGGWNPLTGARTAAGDPTQYWMRFDWLRRKSYMTYGFLRLEDPHDNATHNYGDVRLGSDSSYRIAANEVCRFQALFEPSLSTLPTGTRIEAQYRGATTANGWGGGIVPFDPYLPGDANVRKANGGRWQYKYNNQMTKYTAEPNDLFDQRYLTDFAMKTSDPRVINFRFLFENNPDAANPKPPVLDSFALTYRIEEAVQ
ncbi:MAG: hypothetical protein R3F30_12025 [Planctomycetota bacterium]